MSDTTDREKRIKRKAGYRAYHKLCCQCRYFDARYTHTECKKLEVIVDPIAVCKHWKEEKEEKGK